MKGKTYILLSLTLIAMFSGLAIWNFSANTASAQKSDADEDLGVVTEYNARNEFALTQGGTSGVWNYGFTANDASNAFLPFTQTVTNTCGGSPAEGWESPSIPDLFRYAANCNSTPTDFLHVHPGLGGQRVILRWVAPAAGNYQLAGILQKAENASATTDLRIVKNENGASPLFIGNILTTSQTAFNFSVTVVAGDTIDFSVGWGNGAPQGDGSALKVIVSQPAEFNARNDFLLTQGGTNGIWSYGYTANATSNPITLYPNGAVDPARANTERWNDNSLGAVPGIYRNPFAATVTYSPIVQPSELLNLHPGVGGQRSVVRWTAPAAGTFLVNGVFQGLENTSSDVKIIKNETETLFDELINGNRVQRPFSFTVTVAAGDKIDFSVGWGSNGNGLSDSTGLAVTIGQPVTACLTAPANLQVNVPAENSPSDVQSVNTNAQLVGDATYDTGKVGKAFKFDGTGDYVRIEDNAAQKPINQLTLEGWFKLNNTSGFQFLASKALRGTTTRSYALWIGGGALHVEYRSTSGSVLYNTGIAPPVNAWTHYAMVINTDDTGATANTMKLYANGVEIYSNAANDPIFYDGINNANTPLPFLVGGGFDASNNPNYHFNGQADEVSVYGRALAQSEIFDIVQQGSFGKCPPAACVQSPNNLVSWFAGEQNALDSRSNNHGTNNGATFTTGKVGQAFNFNGASGNFISFGNTLGNFGTSDFAVEFWMQTSNNRLEQIISKRAGCTGGEPAHFSIRKLPTGRLVVELYNGVGQVVTFDSNQIITDGLFHYVTLQRVGDSLQLYIDGVLDNSGTGAAGMNLTNNGQFSIGGLGCAGVDGTETFTGVIDEVSLYNRALTTTEISSICNAGQSGKCKPSPLDPTTNQVAWFTADGDTRDFTGLNPNGILRGDANYKVGKVGQGFNFDGNDDAVEVADDADHKPTNQLTLEGWFKPNNLNGVQFLASKPFSGNGTIRSYALWNGPTLHIEYNSTSGSVLYNTGITPQNNVWTHYAMVINTDDAGATANTIKLYINGAEVFSNTANNPIVYGAAIPFLIGAGADSLNNPTFFFNGQADEVSLYSRALSASEIGAIYNAGTAGKLKSAAVNFIPPTVSKNSKRGSLESNLLLQPATVQLSDATVSFANVTGSGTVSENGIDLGFLPKLPSSVIFTGLAYDISTTASYQNGSPDDVQVCFNVPALANLTFSSLRILHLESGTWVNRTATGNTSPNLCTDNLTSLSPFVIVQSLAPTAANVSVSGRVGDASGFGISGVNVTLTDSQGRSVYGRTNNFGRYSFGNVSAGDVYIVSVASKRYEFAVSSQAINVVEAMDNVDFTANSSALR